MVTLTSLAFTHLVGDVQSTFLTQKHPQRRFCCALRYGPHERDGVQMHNYTLFLMACSLCFSCFILFSEESEVLFFVCFRKP
jgi:hypothetical protein